MAMSSNRQDRDYDKYVETADGSTAVRVQDYSKIVTGGFDYVAATYPTSTSEVYVFKTGGAGGTTVSTVTVVYTDSTKNFISTVTRT